MKFTFEAVGVIHSPYKEKFAVPRQPGLVPAAEATLELQPPYNQPEAVRGLEGYSHLWLVFVFNQTMAQGWRPTVRPPRLGGNERMGVFATRSTFRPNPIGLSVVELSRIEHSRGAVRLHLRGVDLVNGTPVLDIKPYIPYADSLPHASSVIAASAPDSQMTVDFSDAARQQLLDLHATYPRLQALIEQVLAQDPRPAYRCHDDDPKEYAVHLEAFNVRWRVRAGRTLVTAIESTAIEKAEIDSSATTSAGADAQ